MDSPPSGGVNQDKEPIVVFNYSKKHHRPFFGALLLTIWLVSWMASLLSPLILIICFFTGMWKTLFTILIIAVIAYIPGYGHSELVRSLFRESVKYWRSSSLIFEEPINPSEKTMFLGHPHGIFVHGFFQVFIRPETLNIWFCFAPAAFYSPFCHLLARLLGNAAPSSKPSVEGMMKEGKSVALVPGGFEEATLASYGNERAYLNRRKGFVKLALRTGHCLRPVYSFGENSTYYNMQGMTSCRLAMNKKSLPAVLPFGRWFFPLLPMDEKMHIVIGRSLRLPKIESPTREDVIKYHKMYIDELKRLFTRYQKVFGVADLEIV